jgi:hypothetical protein
MRPVRFDIFTSVVKQPERETDHSHPRAIFVKWVPLHEGVLGEWAYSSAHSLTSALDGGEW